MFVGMYSETNLINLPTTTGDVIGHMLFVHNLYPSGLYSINGVFWSIAIEFQFYIFYALLYKWFNFKLSQLLGFIVIALIFYGCASCFMRLENNWRIIGQHLFITTFWSWYLGALIAEWSINSKIKDYLLLRTSNSIGINIILLFVISLNLFCSVGDPVLFRLHYIYWIVPIFSALLIFILAIMDGCETLIVGMFKKLKWIGAISYSLYLLHPVGIALALKIFGPLSLFSQFMAIAFSFTLAILSYLLIEKPFMRLQKSLK
jgi:peptidoglycan/LPS O-acetylase OafA/YrhL